MTDTDSDPDDGTCPTCEQEFDSERAMKIHHATAHGESLHPTRECPTCGDEFVDTRSSRDQTYCSTECHHEALRQRVELECLACGDTFDVRPSKADYRTYCSIECRRDRVELECEACGDDFEVVRHRADRARFCSSTCQASTIAATGDSRDHLECEACGNHFRSHKSDQRYCCKTCYYESIRGGERPDDVDELLRELYADDGYSHWETWKRAGIVLDDPLTQAEVRQRLEDMGVFASQRSSYKALLDADPDDVGDEVPDGDSGWQDYYHADGGEEA